MSEKQEKVWVVMRATLNGESVPNKVFDDRKDARNYASRADAASKRYAYWVVGVKKG